MMRGGWRSMGRKMFFALGMVIRRVEELVSLYLSRSIPVWLFFIRYL
jgi:hypothetical protein